MNDFSGRNLPDVFFDEARLVLLGEKDRIHFDGITFLRIVTDPALRTRFKHLFRQNCQNPELQDIIFAFLEEIADEENNQSREYEVVAKGVDHYVGGVGVGACVAGVAGILATSGAGAIIFLAGGLISIASAGVSSSRLRRKATRKQSDARKLARLIRDLKDHNIGA